MDLPILIWAGQYDWTSRPAKTDDGGAFTAHNSPSTFAENETMPMLKRNAAMECPSTKRNREPVSGNEFRSLQPNLATLQHQQAALDLDFRHALLAKFHA